MTTAAAEDRERVGPYRVIKAIGAGGSARIDLARIDRAYGFQRHVVVKRPLEHLRGNAGVAASLRREARIGGRLGHPNLVAILDAGIHDGYDYLVLEYVHGAALRTLMQADAPGQVRELPLAVTLAIVSDVARGMHEAHELTDDHGAPLGLVHRDVSPGNILLGLDGTVKLADFGIAKETRVSTLSGSMHGTVTYMAPEQCQGHAFDRRADVFSLGVILYELVTGTRLFWADNDVASLHRVLSGTVPRPRQVRPQLPSALEDILLIAVAHDADQRYPTALALATALERYAAEAGEVIGARWIARTMEDVVGPRQVPWIASATVPDATPRGDGSLVDLIAAAEPDEPVPPSFGDTAEELSLPTEEPSAPAGRPAASRSHPAPVATADLAPAGRAPIAAAGHAPVATASPAPVATAGRRPRHRRSFAAGLIALAVIGGGAAAAVVMTRSSGTSALHTTPTNAGSPRSVATPATSAGSPTSAAPPATSTPSPTSATPPATAVGSPSPLVTPTANAPAPTTNDRAPAAPITGDRAPAESIVSTPAPHRPDGDPRAMTRAPAPSTTAGKRKHHGKPAPRAPPPGTDDPKVGEHDATPPPVETAATAGAGSGSAPAPRTPAKVEWKSTLLLPTDGSGARGSK